MATAQSRQTISRLYDGQDYEGEYGDGDTIGIGGTCGKRGSGKTFREWLSINLCNHRLIVFDSENQYRPPKYSLAGYVVFSQPGELRQFLATQLNADRFRVIYKPLAGIKLHHFRTVAELVLRYGTRLHEQGRGVVYFVDEIDQFCPPHEKLERFCPELNEMIEYGRHRGVSLGWTSRRPYRVHPNLRAQTSKLRIFRTSEPRDLEHFEKIIGSAVNELPKLGQYKYLEWVDDANVEPQIKGGPR